MIAITQSWATLARTGMKEAPSATRKVKRIVTSLCAAPDACASAAMWTLIRTSIKAKAKRGSRDHGRTKVTPAKTAADAANQRIWLMSEPGIWSGPMVAIAPASAIAAHTAAAVRLVSWLSTLAFNLLGPRKRPGCGCATVGDGYSSARASASNRRFRPTARQAYFNPS